ncbi:MAG TPA: YdeI/OmpD-associated family protein, partial [Chitinophagaceae bacterium]|nr:YdeI/OmpD-associated family protein [Chitinophagaceae bacterium]
GKLDELSIQSVALLPMGDGNFIMPINASMRKSLRKQKGAMLEVQLQEDTTAFVFNKDFKICLEDEPSAKKFFETLPASHQKYFSKWIDSAKTEPTKVKRIAMAVAALARQMGYGEMIREQKNLK